MSYHEPKDPRTGKAPNHQAAAINSKDISNANILKSIPGDFFDKGHKIVVGYNIQSGVPYLINAEVEIRKQMNGIREFSMCGDEGEFMLESKHEKMTEEFFEDIDMESDFGHIADDVIGTSYSDDEFYDAQTDAQTDLDREDYEDDEEYDDAVWELASENAEEAYRQRREEYLESLKCDLESQEDYPYELNGWYTVDGESYVSLFTSSGQIFDTAEIIPVIPSSDWKFLRNTWDEWHISSITGKGELPEHIASRVYQIISSYEEKGGENFYISKVYKKLKASGEVDL